MPVTAKLSRSFYDRLGDDVANELVEWLNAVDTSYRQEFRELFEAHFGRLQSEMSAIESRFDIRIAALEARFDSRITALESRLESRMDVKLEALKAELLRWMFLFWVGSMGTIVAVLKL